MHRTVWNTRDPVQSGYWGPVTASIDWCEANYEVTVYIAEAANTLSNILFIGLALFGAMKSHQQELPFYLTMCDIGIGVVGVGSFLFHATLLYEWQLADELPML